LQPVSGLNWKAIGTGVGTTTIDSPVVLGKIVIPGTYVGTIIFYDSASGTADEVFRFGNPLTNTFQTVTPELQFKNGMVIDCQGTPKMTLGLK
jgi:hypothetical protein